MLAASSSSVRLRAASSGSGSTAASTRWVRARVGRITQTGHGHLRSRRLMVAWSSRSSSLVTTTRSCCSASTWPRMTSAAIPASTLDSGRDAVGGIAPSVRAAPSCRVGGRPHRRRPRRDGGDGVGETVPARLRAGSVGRRCVAEQSVTRRIATGFVLVAEWAEQDVGEAAHDRHRSTSADEALERGRSRPAAGTRSATSTAT